MSALITTGQAAKKLKVSRQTVVNWCNQGRVPGAQKTAASWVIPLESLDLIDFPEMGRPPKQSNEEEE